MSALENAKNMSVEDILAKTAASGLLEFGVERGVVTEKWNQVNAEREFQTNPIRVVAGLNNADIAGVQLEVLKADPKKSNGRYGNRSAGSKCRRNVSVPSGERN
ncbi:hypothetical protein [Eubacterium ramulus]|uniref:hypothetical protein n=1 Tax=Eubacterium ramulus TaxID=39490 RepID=UPI00399BD137